MFQIQICLTLLFSYIILVFLDLIYIVTLRNLCWSNTPLSLFTNQFLNDSYGWLYLHALLLFQFLFLKKFFFCLIFTILCIIGHPQRGVVWQSGWLLAFFADSSWQHQRLWARWRQHKNDKTSVSLKKTRQAWNWFRALQP